MSDILRFPDLAAFGIKTRQTLARRIAEDGFPKPFKLGSNSHQIAWLREDIERWVEAQASAAASGNGNGR